MSFKIISPKAPWKAPVCVIYGVIRMHAGCQLLCINWIRSKISLSDQGRDRVRLKDLRLHLPMNIWCLSEGTGSDPPSDHQGVAGNLPYLHLATFQQFPMWRHHHIPLLLKSHATAEQIEKTVLFIFSQWQLVCFVFLSPSLPQRPNTITDSYFLQRLKRSSIYSLSAKQILDNCWNGTWHPKSLSTQLNVASSQQIKMSCSQSHTPRDVTWPQSCFYT